MGFEARQKERWKRQEEEQKRKTEIDKEKKGRRKEMHQKEENENTTFPKMCLGKKDEAGAIFPFLPRKAKDERMFLFDEERKRRKIPGEISRDGEAEQESTE